MNRNNTRCLPLKPREDNYLIQTFEFFRFWFVKFFEMLVFLFDMYLCQYRNKYLSKKFNTSTGSKILVAK